MREIELKAHVRDRPCVREKICSFADYRGCAEKSDVYWYNRNMPVQAQTVRVREQKNIRPDGVKNTELLVTCKRKEMRSGIEVNDETEFAVSNRAAFEVFLRDAGYEPVRSKSKSTESWVFEDVFIELCKLDGLGDFIEIEILSDGETVTHIETCRKKLLNILEQSGVSESCIETAYYSELLLRAGL